MARQTSELQEPRKQGGTATVQAIGSTRELAELLDRAGGRPIVLNFWTETCGFCHLMMPHFERHAEEYRGRAYFRTVNIREQPKIAKAFKVSGLPNFKFVLRKKVIEAFRGADTDGLRRYLQKAVHRADKEEIKVTRGDLIEFFREHDPEVAGSEDSIDLLLAQGSADLPLLLEALKTQYGAMPRYTGGFIEQGAADDAAGPAVDGVGGAAAAVPPETCARATSAASLPTAELEAELARRRTAAAAAHGPTANPCTLFRQRRPGAVERVVIIGSGPAGMSAALYAARSALCPLVVAPAAGGQLMMKGVDVENFPGLPRASGRDMIRDMRLQSEGFHAEVRVDMVVEVDLSRSPFELRTNSSGSMIRAESLVIATGSNSRWLGVPGEEALRGRGVSGCAACDGYLHRDEACVVIGGGDSALEDALMLSRICSNVTLVHRRGELRAGRILQDRMQESGVVIKWHTEVVEFKAGRDARLSQVLLRDSRTGSVSAADAGAAFVAIGHVPNTGLFKGQLAMDDAGAGYLKVEGRTTRTSVAGVFAAGDVADPVYRQAITSAGSGAQAALDAERWLSEQGPPQAPATAQVRPEDFDSWALPEVRAHLEELGLPCESCSRKSDFVTAIRRSWL